MSQTDPTSPFLPLPEGVSITSVEEDATSVLVHIACHHPCALCPGCSCSSDRIHGAYVRTVADLPAGGRRVILKLRVRRFVCPTSTCSHSIFTERLDSLVHSYARMTNRLSETLQTLGFATCGELGERLAPKLGMQVSGPTLLRRMRARIYTPPTSVPIVGIDDWAWKKGMTYGTLVVDLQSRRPIELLEDRSAQTAETWLRSHPEITLVSRDRGGDYAAAAKRGAPQAEQVADKFHLLKNLRERIKEVMDRRHSCLPHEASTRADAIPARARGIKGSPTKESVPPSVEVADEKHYRTIPPTPYWRPPPDNSRQLHRQARRERRYGLYEEVRRLNTLGIGVRAIARQLKVCREVVRRFLKAEEYPEMASHRRGPRGSMLDQYKPYIRERWEQGCRNSVQLYDEIKARGYTGSTSLLRNFLASVRKQYKAARAVEVVHQALTPPIETSASPPPQPLVKRRMSPTRASWLLVSRSEKLDEQQRKYVEQIREGHPDLETAYQLGQQFVMMLAEHRDRDLDAWLQTAEQSILPEFRKMARGIRLDYAAVRAAFSSIWSNGQVEAQVNCLKLQKRIVFGRANFDLLRLRVLCRV
ncbi:ISL3 family transposase [Ktedonosporobacter rubrisoli]|nr:ISL3 family transposase [Ktedonosporobacter rubrisoli]